MAVECGLANAVLPAAEVVNHARRVAERFNTLPPGAVRETKQLMRRVGREATLQAMQVEGERWVVTLSGAGVDQPPTDEAAFLDFARDLISPRLYHAIRDAEPLSAVRGWARTANRWRHVERVRWPAGFSAPTDST